MFPYVIIDEECGGFASLSRSREITAGKESSVIVYFLLFFAILFVTVYSGRFIPPIVGLLIKHFIVLPLWICSWAHVYRTIKPK